jgi:hypothetical protein
VASLDDVDISWIIGLVVPAACITWREEMAGNGGLIV